MPRILFEHIATSANDTCFEKRKPMLLTVKNKRISISYPFQNKKPPNRVVFCFTRRDSKGRFCADISD